MSRREAIVLVSRALACIQLITALLDATYLPERVLAFLHYANLPEATTNSQHYFRVIDTLSVFTLIVRIGILLVTFLIFWNCGAWIERTLLPSINSSEDPAP